MTLTKKIIEEFEENFIKNNKRWELVPNTPRKIMMSDIEVVEMFGNIKTFLLSSLQQVATEAIEAVRVEKKEISYSQEEQKVLEEIFGKYETPEYLRERIYGYNSAITAIEQKAKKFLEDNYKNISQ